MKPRPPQPTRPHTLFPYTTLFRSFMHSLAFNEPLKGLSPERLRYSIVGPSCDVSFVEEARKAFVQQSAYLDDRPGALLRFLAEANLTQIVQIGRAHV